MTHVEYTRKLKRLMYLHPWSGTKISENMGKSSNWAYSLKLKKLSTIPLLLEICKAYEIQPSTFLKNAYL